MYDVVLICECCFWNSSNLIKACPGLAQAPSTSGAATVLTPPTSTSDLDVNFKNLFGTKVFTKNIALSKIWNVEEQKQLNSRESKWAGKWECSRRRHHFPPCRLHASCQNQDSWPTFLTTLRPGSIQSLWPCMVTRLPCMSDGNSYVMGTEWP